MKKVHDPIHILSLGAGVQSSTMALMAAAGEISPMPGYACAERLWQQERPAYAGRACDATAFAAGIGEELGRAD